MTPKTSFAHFTFATRDVVRASKFYATTFGWEPIHRPQNIEMPAAWLQMAPDQEVHFLQIPDFEISRHEAEFGRHIALAYPRTAFPELKKRLVEHGAELGDPIRETPFERFFFRDPDGYIIEVVDADHEPERGPGVDT